MRHSDVIPVDEQARFWNVVRECIRRFHPRCADAAMLEVTRLISVLDTVPLEQMELFYHAEPFDVACNLARNPLLVEDYVNEYLSIRDADIGVR